MNIQSQDSSALPPEDAPEHIFHHPPLPQTRLSRPIEGAIERIGGAVSWVWIVLMLIICGNVFMKNVLHRGSIQLEEIQWHIYSALFLLGLSYAMVRDDHVRVDVLFEHLKPRTAAWVEAAGLIVFMLPFVGVLIWYAVPFVLSSYLDAERSISPAGLSHYWILKGVLLFSLVLLLLATIARLSRCIHRAARREPAPTARA